MTTMGAAIWEVNIIRTYSRMVVCKELWEKVELTKYDLFGGKWLIVEGMITDLYTKNGESRMGKNIVPEGRAESVCLFVCVWNFKRCNLEQYYVKWIEK